jgi:hypothetical protein
MWRGVLLLSALMAAAGPDTAASAAGSGNPTNDRLLALPSDQQAKTLAKGIKGCDGTSAFPMGVVSTAKFKSLAYWSVSCKDGRNFALQIAPDAKGTTQVADCKALEGTGKECFKKF